MAIRTVVTRGYGNGTFNGTIALVVTRGYAIGSAYVGIVDATVGTTQQVLSFVGLKPSASFTGLVPPVTFTGDG